MKNLKRRLASLLTLAMLLSMLPVGTLAAEPQPPEEEPLYVEVSGQKVYLEPVTISTFSTQPLEVKYYTLDLRGYFPEELKEFSVSDMLSKLAKRNGTTEEAVKDPSKVAAFKAEWEYYDENGEYVGNDYAILGENKTLNLSRDSWYGGSVTLELIVGTVDQLNQRNIRYRIYIQTSGFRNLLIPEAYSVDDLRQPIGIYNSYNTSYGNGTRFRMIIDPKTWQYGKEAYLGLTLDPAVAGSAGLDVEVYSGRYDTEIAIMEANPPIVTSQIMDQANLSTAGGYQADYSGNRNYNQLPQFTFLFRRDGKTVKILPISVEMREGHVSVGFDYDLYADASGSSSYRSSVDYGYRFDGDDNNTQIFYLKDYPTNGTYYYNLRADNPDPAFTGNDVDCIKQAVLGLYDTADQIPADAADIKEKLFSDASRSGGGYGADYSSGVSFTVVDIEDKLYQFTVKTEEETETYLPPEAKPLSGDTYFRMRDADDAAGNSIDEYLMPYDMDTYYSNGFQTVFLLNSDGKPVTEGSKIKPEFWTYDTVNVFAGHTEKGQTISAEKQTSKVTERIFENGKAIQYSAAAEDNRSLKNYWVTFLTQQSGPKLFVNGTNVESLWEEEHEGQGDLIPVRELFLTEGSEEASYYNRHEVFLANIGDADLTNLSAEIVGAQNVKLDDYWKIGATTTLSKFDKTYSDKPYSEPANVAKIRLVPTRDTDGRIIAGEISGTLVIKADGEGNEVRIKLKGIAGAPQIVTDTIRDGVKYVHYSSLIQTNSIHSENPVTFSVTGGRLPQGMQLKPNGELYGVPTETGSFTFTATATMTFGDRTYTDSKEFTFTIAENTRDNVEAGNLDPAIGYPFENNQKIWDVDYTGESQEQIQLFDQDMVSQGPFNEFMNVYLDGRLLTPGVDYNAEEGSTRITVQAQTFRNAGNGTHTISAEFRTNKDANGTMHRTAQNFTISGLPSSSGGSGGGGGGSSESSRYSVSVPTFSHGTVTVESKTVRQGDLVIMTVTPDAGYQLGTLKVTGPRDKEITVTRDANGKYTFRMPNGTANIYAEFVPVGSEQPEQPSQPTPAGTTPFVDMLETDWFYSAVAQVYEKGWMTGTSENTFAPRSKTSRGMIVTVLHKLEGNPEAEGSYFSDVPLNCYYTRAVSWAAEQGIISGYGDGRFGPDDSLTREQIVMILYSYAKYKGMDLSARSSLEQFTDLDQLSSEAQQAMAWAHGVGLISGKGDGILDPIGPATRAEMAALLVRFVSLMENGQ